MSICPRHWSSNRLVVKQDIFVCISKSMLNLTECPFCTKIMICVLEQVDSDILCNRALLQTQQVKRWHISLQIYISFSNNASVHKAPWPLPHAFYNVTPKIFTLKQVNMFAFFLTQNCQQRVCLKPAYSHTAVKSSHLPFCSMTFKQKLQCQLKKKKKETKHIKLLKKFTYMCSLISM